MAKSGIGIFAAAALAATPVPVQATAYCSGFVTNVLTYSSGEVMIDGPWRSDWTSICNVNQEWKGVPPQTCYLWFSNISSSITENKSVNVYYPALEQAECATMPTYGNSPAPGYIMLAK